MDTRRFDALARALGIGARAASRRRLLQALPAVAVGSLLPRPAALALDTGDEAGCPVPARCTGTADCPPGQICVSGTCQASAGSAVNPTATPINVTTAPSTATAAADGGETGAGGATAAQETPADGGETGAGGATAAQETPADGGAPTPTPRTITEGGTEATETPATATAPAGPFAAQIHAGLCGELDATPAFQLLELGTPEEQETTPAADAQAGAATAFPALFSTTIVDTTLDELLDAPFAVDVRADADDPGSSVVCGDVGGRRVDGALAIGLRERNGSGTTGIAWLREEGERTLVTVFLAQGLATGGPTAAVGSAADAPADETPAPEATAPPEAAIEDGETVVTTEAVNLRATPSTDAQVLAEIPAGTALTVIGEQDAGWITVLDPATARPGYVSAEFVATAE